MYTEAGLDPSLFDRHRSKRGPIQHGAKLPSTGYLNEVFQDLSQVQTAAVVAVTKKVGISPGTTSYLSTCWPVVVFSCRVEQDGNITIQNSSMNVNAALNTLPQRISGDAGRAIFLECHPSSPKSTRYRYLRSNARRPAVFKVRSVSKYSSTNCLFREESVAPAHGKIMAYWQKRYSHPPVCLSQARGHRAGCLQHALQHRHGPRFGEVLPGLRSMAPMIGLSHAMTLIKLRRKDATIASGTSTG